MRKELLFAGILSATTSLAHAQSSVTLYGLIDTGITFVSNQGGSHNVQTSAGSLNGNRWGLKGAEVLGGGLSSLFTIESGYGIL
ncbi:MAG: porin, partial [Rhodospirillales bacterium]|nr:porin [Rhodospirillales bacterium]